MARTTYVRLTPKDSWYTWRLRSSRVVIVGPDAGSDLDQDMEIIGPGCRTVAQLPTGGHVPRHQDRNAAVRAETSVGAAVVDVVLELPKGNLVDAGGGLDGGPRCGAAQEPLDGSNSPLQFSFPGDLP